jgi:ribose transport system permease protein
MTTSITKLLKSTQSSSMLAKYLLPVLALLLIVAFSLYLPDTFPTSVTVRSIIDAQAITALLALAEMLVVIAGEYDLSVGYSCGMINILVIGFIVKDHVPLPLTIILALVIGSGLGLINGLLVYVCKIDSFIATLGSGTVAYAVSNWYTQGNQVFGTLPTALTDIYTTRVFDVPIAAFMVVFVAGVLWFLLEYTPTGRRLYALGSNKRAAELTGISSRRYVIGVFVTSGAIVGATGILLASRLRIGEVSTGPDYLLPVFVGAILGSVTLKPGRPNAWGTVVAVLLLGIGIAGLQQMGASYYVTPLFDGLTLIVGVGAAGYANRRIRREPLRLDPGDGDDRPSAPAPALETNTTH